MRLSMNGPSHTPKVSQNEIIKKLRSIAMNEELKMEINGFGVELEDLVKAVQKNIMKM
jgi:hypothetical protein